MTGKAARPSLGATRCQPPRGRRHGFERFDEHGAGLAATHHRHPRPTGRAADRSDRPAGGPGRLPVRGGAVRSPLPAVRAGRRDPGRPARLQVPPRAAAAQRHGADARAQRHGRHHRVALLDHPERALCAARGQLRRGGGRADLPVRGRFPHRRAVLHRRLRRVLLPDPGRRSAGESRGRGGHAAAHGRAPRGEAAAAVGPAAPSSGRGALPRGPQHLVRQRARVAAGDPGGRHRPAHAGHPLLLHPERVRDLRRRQRP